MEFVIRRTHLSGQIGVCLAILAASPLAAQYAGPAILSRGEAPSALAAPQVRFRPYVSAQATYDSGLANVSLDSSGQLAKSNAPGIRLGWGISGTHSWQRTKLGLSYNGSLEHYPGSAGYDSTDHALMVGLTRRFSPRASLTLGASAGTFSRDFGLRGLPASVPFDPNTTFVPTTDYFDNRTYFLGSQADLTLQKSARTSFNFGGSEYITDRRSSSLSSNTSQIGRADVQHRFTRRITLGAAYFYTHFSYTHPQADTNVHSAGPTLGIQVTRWLEITGMIGVARVENKSMQQAAVDPVIAALLGIGSAPQIVYRVEYLKVPTFMARASRAFRTGYVYGAGGHSITPGNGLFQTSYVYTALAGYSYTGLRRWSVNSQVAYMDGHAVGAISGNYGSTSGALSLARRVYRGVSFAASLSARKYSSRDYSGYDRVIYTVSTGLTWSPGDVPVRLW